jgi:polyferredoxin
MYDTRCCHRTDNRGTPWRYATGSCDASGTNYRIGISRFDGHRCAECSDGNRGE